MEYVEKLNIVMSYPIQWDNYKVLENFTQNFYDAIGYKSFGTSFKYTYDEGEKKLEMISDKSFDIKYLCALGASSKRSGDVAYAGHFGEGFKLAALCGYRDLGYRISMHSGDWQLEVTEAEDYIDKVKVSFLAYKVSTGHQYGDTRLTIENVESKDYKVFRYEIGKFFYQENPCFGDVIYESKNYAIYHSAIKDKNAKGRLFLSLQERAYLPFPVILCNHQYVADDDRDRIMLSHSDFANSVIDIIGHTPDDALLTFLELLKPAWGGRKDLGWYGKCYPDIIMNITRWIDKDSDAGKRFIEKYAESLVADDFFLPSEEKRLIKSWFQSTDFAMSRRKVLACFAWIGIKPLKKLCAENDGFILELEPDFKEQKCIDVLRRCGEELFADLYCYNHLPGCRIIKDYAGNAQGIANTVKAQNAEKNKLGMKVKREIRNICLRKSLFKKKGFADAFTTYIHELLHQYGGDASVDFRKVLLIMNTRLIEAGDITDRYRKEWDECFG